MAKPLNARKRRILQTVAHYNGRAECFYAGHPSRLVCMRDGMVVDVTLVPANAVAACAQNGWVDIPGPPVTLTPAGHAALEGEGQ